MGEFLMLRFKIISLKKEGKSNKDIAKELGITISTVRYHTDIKYRQFIIDRGKYYFRNMTPEERIKYNESRRNYNKNYQRSRYHQDETFRNKKIQSVKLRRQNGR